MKFVSFKHDGEATYGLVVDGGIVDLGKRTDSRSLRDAIANDPSLGSLGGFAGEKADYRIDDVAFLPVITDADKILCVGLNYHEHVKETGREVTEKPILFPRFNNSQIGHGVAALRPRESEKFDFEGELAVIIGAGGRRIAAKDAMDHIAGYACYNDISVRDWQRHTSQFLPGKNFSATGAFGPHMVTRDDVGDITACRLETRLNGESVQSASIGDMIIPIPILIEYISTFTELYPGDVIVTGTPGGVGAKRTPPLWMKPGDVCEVEIENVGRLVTPIAGED